MKKITLLAFFILALQADAQPRNFPRPQSFVLFNFENPIAFNERGIDFYIFPNGEFDFNTERSTASADYYRPRFQQYAPDDVGVRIEHDLKGRVRRIGNVFINYDMNDRVKRIGSVYLAYHRSALVQVGGMRLKYDNRGRLVAMNGSINGERQQYAYHYGQNNFNQSWHYGTVNENEYYYKSENNPLDKKDKELD